MAECESLVDFYNRTGGTNWLNNAGWNQTKTPCSWYGVTCEGGHVTEIRLDRNKLSGNLPNLSLPNLKILYLVGNQLTGSIPNLSNSPNLTWIALHDNQLSGSIPDFDLKSLQSLSLGKNLLSGSIPSFSKATNLEGIYLSYNQLSGSIPNFNLPRLKNLFLEGNKLSGRIPNFTAFDLSKESFEIDFGDNCGLIAYDDAQESVLNSRNDWKKINPTCIDWNTIVGISTTECQDLVKLYDSTGGTNWINRANWKLTNTPCSWFGITCAGGHVQKIELTGNGLRGSIPNLTLPYLEWLGLDNNQLTGSLPNFNLPNLKALGIGGTNQLTGTIPNLNLPNLQYLALDKNKLTGSIPNFNFPNLQGLQLDGNQLSGGVPNFNFPNLQSFMLQGNQLCGILPNFTAFNLSNLYIAKFNNNCGLYAADTAQETALNTKDAQWKTKNPSCPATPNPACTANFDVTVTKTGNGQVNSGGKYAVGATVNLTATPDASSTFTGWTPAPCAASFTMPANSLTCTANFSTCAYTISPTTKTHTANKETGTITITPSAASCPVGTPASNSEWLTITSVNGNTINYEVGANAATTGRTGTLTIAGQTFTVTQAAGAFGLTTNKIGTGTVMGDGNYAAGATVTLTATPADTNSTFTGWIPAPCAASFVMPANPLVCTANFTTCTYILGSSSKTHSANAEVGSIAVTTQSGCTIPAQSNVPSWVTISAPTGNTVNYAISTNTTAERTGTLTIAGQTFTVTQAAGAFPLTVNTNGMGTVTGSGNYLANTTVTLTATPADTNSAFTGWTPAPCAASFAMPANPLTCTANFSACTYTLGGSSREHTANAETGSVAVTTQSSCTIPAQSNVPWLKVSVPTGNPVNYTVDANNTISQRSGILTIGGQTFTITQPVGEFPVTLNKTGNGTGTTIGDGDYLAGTVVTLTATAADVNSTFIGWTPAPCAASFTMPAKPLTCIANFSTCTYTLGGSSKTHTGNAEKGNISVITQNACTVVAQSDASWLTVSDTTGNIVNYALEANNSASERKGVLTIGGQTFTITQSAGAFPLSVNKNGTGTVAGEGNYPAGTTVTLIATPDSGSTFMGWTPAPCAASFNMPDNPLTCIANFSVCTYTLGALSKTHTVNAEIGSVFVNTQSGCTVTAQSSIPWVNISNIANNVVNYEVQANTTSTERSGTLTIAGQIFTVSQPLVPPEKFSVTITSSGAGTTSGGGNYAEGTQVNLSAISDANSTFIGWSGDCSGTTNPYPLMVDAAKNCVATFGTKTYQVSTGGKATFSPTTQLVEQGQSVTFSVFSIDDQLIEKIEGCNGVWEGGNSYTTGTITENCIVFASAKGVGDKTTHTLTAIQNSHGKIKPDSATIEDGKSAYFMITPEDGYKVDSVEGCNGSFSSQNNEYTVHAVTEDCQITATFKESGYSIAISIYPVDGGTVDTSTLNIKHGESASFVVIPAAGYEIGGVSGCDATLQSENIYQTGIVTNPCDITIAFKTKGQLTIKSVVDGNGSISPQAISLDNGSIAIFDLTPEEGYEIKSIEGCDGYQQDETYTTGTIIADCTITAVFSMKQYTIQTEIRPNGAGSVSLSSESVEHGKTVDFSVIPNDGYEVELTRGCNGEQIIPSNNLYTTRPIVDNCTLLADFKLKKYEVKLTHQFTNAPPIAVNLDPIEHGQSTSFDISSDSGEEIESVIGCNGYLEDSHYTTGIITAPCEMTVYYKESKNQCSSYLPEEAVQVTVPCVEIVGQGIYTGQMKLIPAISPAILSFEVLMDSLKLVDNIIPSDTCAIFPADSDHPIRLRLNCVTVANENYWAELDLINDPSLIQFNLFDYGVMAK